MTSSKRSQCLLLVDGYNVIGTWSCLQKTRDQHGLEAARNELIETLINYTCFKGLETQIVFDAYYQNSASKSEMIITKLSVHYTGFGETADTYIEKLCASFRPRMAESSQRVIVATSDRIQQLVVGGYGAEWMSSQQLAEEVEATARRLARQHQPKKQPASRFLFNALDPHAQQRLAEWRKGLK